VKLSSSSRAKWVVEVRKKEGTTQGKADKENKEQAPCQPETGTMRDKLVTRLFATDSVVVM